MTRLSVVGTLRALRLVIALVAAVDVVSFVFFVADARARALARGVELGAVVDVLSSGPSRFALAAAGLGAAALFARRPGALLPGVLVLLVLLVESATQAQLLGRPWRHMHYSGLVLLGWLAGLVFARRQEAGEREGYARAGAVGVLGAAYFSAGLSKLVFGGLGWAAGSMVQATVVQQDGMVPIGHLAAYRVWVVSHPLVTGAFASATIVFELAGPLMLAATPVRTIAAAGLVGMHFNIFLLTGIAYWQAFVFLMLFALADYFGSSASDVAERPALRWVYPLAGVCLGLIALGAWGQLRNDAQEQRSLPASAEPGTSVERLGAFRVGDTPVPHQRIQAIRVLPSSFELDVRGPAGDVTFELSCAQSPHQSPFDVGRAHIFYRTSLPYSTIQGVGLAVQDTVVSQGPDPCASWARWRAEAGN